MDFLICAEREAKFVAEKIARALLNFNRSIQGQLNHSKFHSNLTLKIIREFALSYSAQRIQIKGVC